MTLRLGIVGGGGWLGQAIAAGAVRSGLVAPADLALSWRSSPPQGPAGAFLTRDSRELAERSDVIVLSVRPGDWAALDVAAAGKLVVSVMAGIPLAALAARHGADRVVRALPNAAAQVGASYTPFFAAPAATAEDRVLVRELFGACGTVDEVGTEDDIDYLAGLSGTGPAYPALVALAMERDAIAHGLPPELARRAARGLFVGAGRLFEGGGESPGEIVDTFLAYRGMTAAALTAMVEAGLERAIRAGLAAAYARSKTLGGTS